MGVFRIENRPPRIVFMGTPEFAVPVLSAIAEKVARPVLVVSQPDRPKGRGLKSIEPTPVKACAQSLGLPLVQPVKIKTPDYVREVASYDPDIVVVAAYGRILTEALLQVPKLGFVNAHASLLPAYRGAAPINWAIIRGENKTGVTVQKVVPALDAGEVLHVRETPIDPDETAGDLYARLAALGAEAIVEFFEMARSGIESTPQDERGVSFAPPLSKADGLIDWSKPACEIHNLVRGTNPWPGAHSVLSGVGVKIQRTQIPNPKSQISNCVPGEVVSLGRDCITVATGEGPIDLLELQSEGARRLGAADFARGKRITAGTRFG